MLEDRITKAQLKVNGQYLLDNKTGKLKEIPIGADANNVTYSTSAIVQNTNPKNVQEALDLLMGFHTGKSEDKWIVRDGHDGGFGYHSFNIGLDSSSRHKKETNILYTDVNELRYKNTFAIRPLFSSGNEEAGPTQTELTIGTYGGGLVVDKTIKDDTLGTRYDNKTPLNRAGSLIYFNGSNLWVGGIDSTRLPLLNNNTTLGVNFVSSVIQPSALPTDSKGNSLIWKAYNDDIKSLEGSALTDMSKWRCSNGDINIQIPKYWYFDEVSGKYLPTNRNFNGDDVSSTHQNYYYTQATLLHTGNWEKKIGNNIKDLVNTANNLLPYDFFKEGSDAVIDKGVDEAGIPAWKQRYNWYSKLKNFTKYDAYNYSNGVDPNKKKQKATRNAYYDIGSWTSTFTGQALITFNITYCVRYYNFIEASTSVVPSADALSRDYSKIVPVDFRIVEFDYTKPDKDENQYLQTIPHGTTTQLTQCYETTSFKQCISFAVQKGKKYYLQMVAKEEDSTNKLSTNQTADNTVGFANKDNTWTTNDHGIRLDIYNITVQSICLSNKRTRKDFKFEYMTDNAHLWDENIYPAMGPSSTNKTTTISQAMIDDLNLALAENTVTIKKLEQELAALKNK